MSKSIPFFDYPGIFKRDEEKYLSILREVMSRGAFILQKDLEEFEKKIADFIKVKHVFGVADGSNALNLSMLAAGIKAGDEVIVPSHTFIATPSAVHFVGATPVLVDCGPDHMIDPESVKKAITKKTTAIMPVQLNGRTANMDAIQAIAKEHGLKIVEDSAQALGSKFKGQFAGTFGTAGTFSFYPAKLLGAFGDGGAIVTNDDDIAAKIYMLRDHGRDPEGVVRCWGFNSRLDNIQAALLNYKLSKYEGEIKRRREIASRYHAALKDVSRLHLPPAPESDPDHFDVYQNYEIEAERRDELRTHLKANGVGTIIQWGGQAVHQFTELGFTVKPPYTEEMFKKCLLLPMHTCLQDDEVDYVCETIRGFYGGGN